MLWAELCPHPHSTWWSPKSLVSQTGFGIRGFKEVIRLDEAMRVGPNPVRQVLLQEDIRTQTGTEGRWHEAEGEDGHLHAP